MTALPTGIVAGNSGHISHHNTIHALLNSVDAPFALAGSAAGTLAARPAAGASIGSIYVAEDIGRWYGWNGTRWVAPDESLGINVLDHGAKGDGVTNDTAAIQAAINAVPSRGTLYSPPPSSYYKITDELVISSAMTVKSDLSLIVQATANKRAFKVTSSDVHFRKVKIQGPQYANNVALERGIDFVGASAAAPLTNVTAHGCEVSNFGQYGIFGTYIDDYDFSGNKVKDCYYGGIIGLSVLNGFMSRNRVKNIIGTPNAYGMGLSRVSTSSLVTDPVSANNVLALNIVTDVPNWEGLDEHAGTNNKFVDNIVLRCKVGISVGEAANGAAVATFAPLAAKVDGNVIDSGVTNGTAGYGIAFTGAGGSLGSPVQKATGSITNNWIKGHGDQSNSLSGAIYMRDTQSVLVDGNTIVEAGNAAILLANDNYDFSLDGNVITDPWSTANIGIGVYLRSSYNTGRAGGNTFATDAKAATSVLDYCYQVVDTSTNSLALDGDDEVDKAAATYLYDVGGTRTRGPLQAVTTASFTPGSIAAGATWTSAAFSVARGGTAAIGDDVRAYPPTGTVMPDGLHPDGKVTASNAVTVSLANITAGALTGITGTWKVQVVKRGS